MGIKICIRIYFSCGSCHLKQLPHRWAGPAWLQLTFGLRVSEFCQFELKALQKWWVLRADLAGWERRGEQLPCRPSQNAPLSIFRPQDVDDRWSLQFPQLYMPGQQNLYFNKKEFVKCVLYSVYSSLVLFFIPYGTLFDSLRSDGKAIADYQSFALMAQTCLLIVVSVQVRGRLPRARPVWGPGASARPMGRKERTSSHGTYCS